jgi:serine/threonine protein kinase
MAFTLRHYSIIEELEESGKGKVCRAIQIASQRDVVVKELTHDLFEHPDRIERLEKGVRTAGRLNHENIIHVYDYGEDNGSFYMVMEYIDGLNLEQLMSWPSFSKEIALMVVLQALRGLHYAHQKGVAHCDVKPNNILIGKTGIAKLADFGVTHTDNHSERSSISDPIFITPAYMPPEHAREIREHEASQDFYTETAPLVLEAQLSEQNMMPSDIWAVGVILHRIIDGQYPFAGKKISQLVNSIINTTVKPVLQNMASLPEDLAGFIDACLIKEPQYRLSSLGPIIESLEKFFNEIGISDIEKEIEKYVADRVSAINILNRRLVIYYVRKSKEYTTAGNAFKSWVFFEEAKKLGYSEQKAGKMTSSYPELYSTRSSPVAMSFQNVTSLIKSGKSLIQSSHFKSIVRMTVILAVVVIGGLIINMMAKKKVVRGSAPSQISAATKVNSWLQENAIKKPLAPPPETSMIVTKQYAPPEHDLRSTKESVVSLKKVKDKATTTARVNEAETIKEPVYAMSYNEPVRSLFGTIKVRSVPDTAKIFVDDEMISGREIGLGKRLTSGPHLVTIQSEGFVSYKESVNIQSNETMVLNIVLKQEPAKSNGLLHIFSYPWADIYIDGNFMGTTPTPHPITLIEGEHVLLLERAGFKPYSKIVDISSGAVERMQVQLETAQ